MKFAIGSGIEGYRGAAGIQPSYYSEKTSLISKDIMVLLENSAGDPDEVIMATKVLKKRYVQKYHKRAISCMTNASGTKKGKWKTYVVVDGKRKEILRDSEEAIYEELYEFYLNGNDSRKTLKQVFELLKEHKREHQNRSNQTLYIDEKRFGQIGEELRNARIDEITAEAIQRWISGEYLMNRPKADALRKMCQLLNQIFEFGVLRGYCEANPMRYVTASDYLKNCDLTFKKDEDRQFSEEEIERIRAYAEKNLENPRALMILMAIETGMRAGELAALHKEDVYEEFIHIHRQQIRETDAEGHEIIYEVGYTKDERMHPHGGRKVPVTAACKRAIEAAFKLQGESVYLFHDNDEEMVNKASYDRYLHRLCERLGTNAKNNHAFRIAFNSRMIGCAFSSADRALVLGHTVQTNESTYSVSDKRRFDDIRNRLKEDEKNRQDEPNTAGFQAEDEEAHNVIRLFDSGWKSDARKHANH